MPDLTIENIEKLLTYLKSTGDFNQELKRLEIWRNFFETKTPEMISKYLENTLLFTNWFENRSKIALGKYTANGKVQKSIRREDHLRLDEAIGEAKKVMESAGVSGPYINGVHNGGHLGGTVPLTKGDVSSMKPSWLPEGLWIADLSLAPRSQGLPTILLTAALSLKVSRKITEDLKEE